MAIRKILEFPDPRLRTRAAAVEKVDLRIQTLIDDMLETMYDANGIGLAASQIDVHEQVIVIDLSNDRSAPRVFINPEVEVVDESVAVLQFGGGCQGCGMVDLTLKEGVEKTLMDQLPQLTAVKDVTDHSVKENAYY